MTAKDQYAMFAAIYELLHAQQRVLDETTITIQAIHAALCEKFPDFDELKNEHELQLVAGVQQRLNAVRLKEIEAIVTSLKMAAKNQMKQEREQ